MLSTKQRLFMVFICILFVLNFQLDFIDQIFFKSNYLIFKSYQEDSAGIVKNCITNFILNKDFMSPLINSDGTYYLQQVALQGKLMGLFGFVFSFNVTQTILVFQLLNSILLSLVLGYLVIWSIREFGCFSGIILSFTILFSTWVIFMARNIYWVEWLMFLPIIFNLWYFRNGRNITSGYVALYFIIYFTRFCCGFEFTSSYIIAGYLSYLYYYLKNNQTHFLSRSFVMSSCVLFLIPTIAFIIAFIITLLQAYHYLGNWGSVFNVLFFNINKRIGLEKICLVMKYINTQ